MSQMVRARVAVGNLMAEMTSASHLRALRDVLAEAQNPPPEGGADGTIDHDTWSKLASFASHVEGAQLFLVRMGFLRKVPR